MDESVGRVLGHLRCLPSSGIGSTEMGGYLDAHLVLTLAKRTILLRHFVGGGVGGGAPGGGALSTLSSLPLATFYCPLNFWGFRLAAILRLFDLIFGNGYATAVVAVLSVNLTYG